MGVSFSDFGGVDFVITGWADEGSPSFETAIDGLPLSAHPTVKLQFDTPAAAFEQTIAIGQSQKT